MGRLDLPIELLPSDTARTVATPLPSPTAVAPSVLTNRLALATAMALTGLSVLGLTLWFAPKPLQPPELLQLLHGMVLIKGLIALVAAALVWWRFGRPIGQPQVVGYIGALCLSTAALAWLWGLALIPLGALCFYSGLAGLYLVARRDPLLFGRGLPAPADPEV